MSRLGLSLVQTPWTPTTTIIWCLWVEIVMECWLLGFISKFGYLFTEVIKAMVVFIYHNCMFNFVLNKISTLVALIYFRMHRTLFLSLDNGHANVLMTKWTEMCFDKLLSSGHSVSAKIALCSSEYCFQLIYVLLHMASFHRKKRLIWSEFLLESALFSY